jgi:hypothetical protein
MQINRGRKRQFARFRTNRGAWSGTMVDFAESF